MKLKLQLEREVAAKEHQFGLINNKKEQLKQFQDQASDQVRLMSTKVPFQQESSLTEA